MKNIEKHPALSRRLLLQAGAAAATAAFAPSVVAAPGLIHLDVATGAPAGTPWADHLAELRLELMQRTNGRVRLNNYLGGALGDDESLVEAAKRGAIDAYYGPASAAVGIAPELELFNLPYVFSSAQQAGEVIDAHLGELDRLLWERGLKLLFVGEAGFESIGSTFSVPNVFALEGKRMRSRQTEGHLGTWRAFGASPVPIALTEVLTSLQSGLVDGFGGTPWFTVAASWFQAVSHFNLTQHIYEPMIFAFSRSTWEGLSGPVRRAILRTANGAGDHGRKLVRQSEADALQIMRDDGVVVREYGLIQRIGFSSLSSVVHDDFYDATTQAGRNLYDSIVSAL